MAIGFIASKDHQNDGISSKKHLANVSLSISSLGSLLSSSLLWLLRPHLPDLLQDHVAVSVEGLHSGQQFAVVSARDEDEAAGFAGLGELVEGAVGDVVGFEGLQFGQSQFALWLVSKKGATFTSKWRCPQWRHPWLKKKPGKEKLLIFTYFRQKTSQTISFQAGVSEKTRCLRPLTILH